MNNSLILQPKKPCYSLTKDCKKVSKSELRYSLLNDFHISKRLIKALKTYLILHWESEFTFSIMDDGMIERDGINYIAIYHRCSYYQAKRSRNLSLSFREANKEFDLPAYVLIKTLREGEI